MQIQLTIHICGFHIHGYGRLNIKDLTIHGFWYSQEMLEIPCRYSRRSIQCWEKSGKNEYPFLFLKLMKKALYFIINSDVSCGFFVYIFHQILDVAFYSQYFEYFLIKKICCMWPNAFFAPNEMIKWDLPFILYILYCIDFQI